MELHPPAPSADEDVYKLVDHNEPASGLQSTVAGNGEHPGADTAPAPAAGLTAQTMVVGPMVAGSDDPNATGASRAVAATEAQSRATVSADIKESGTATGAH